MALHPNLYRTYEATDISWHHVGPHHERCLFILPDLIGYHPVEHNDKPPYRLYNVFGWSGPKIAENSYATIPAAKRAGRAWIAQWLSEAGTAAVEWRTESSGVHFVANAAGLRIAQYYHNTDPEKPMNPHGGRWSVGFRAHFGGTYYLPPIDTPEKAKQAVAETWDRWLNLAKLHLLKPEKAAA